MVRMLTFLPLALVAHNSDAFVVMPPATASAGTTSRQDASSTALGGMFGGLSGAFANEDMGAKKNEGLSGGPNYNENVTVNGKVVKGAVVGQKLTAVAAKARVKIPTNCQKGDCGTCMVSVNGRKLKACQTALGQGKTSITV